MPSSLAGAPRTSLHSVRTLRRCHRPLPSDPGLTPVSDRVCPGKILAEEKLTPSKTQKILKPFKGRMDPAYFADLLESVQAKPSEFRQAKRREDFVDAIINGIVHRSLQEPNGVQSLFKLDGLQA